MSHLVIEKMDTSRQEWWWISGKDCYITIEHRPPYCDRGRFIAKLHVVRPMDLSIDGADGWPRYYFNKDCMLLEISAWMDARSQHVSPDQVPDDTRPRP